MRTHRPIALLVLAAALASGCASLTPTAAPGLSEQVTLTKQSPFVSVWRSSHLPNTANLEVAAIEWSEGATAAATPDEQKTLNSALDAAVRQRLGNRVRTGTRADGDLILKTTITGVNPSSPAANVALSLIVGPVDTGGASVQFELIDPATNQPLGVLVAAKNGRVFSSKGFRRWGHAEQSFDAAAMALAEFVNASGSASGADHAP